MFAESSGTDFSGEEQKNGEVTERPKVYDWKSYVPQKGTAGSNPALSASIPRAREKNRLAKNRALY